MQAGTDTHAASHDARLMLRIRVLQVFCAAKGRQVVFEGLPSRRPGVEQVNSPMRSQQCLSRLPS